MYTPPVINHMRRLAVVGLIGMFAAMVFLIYDNFINPNPMSAQPPTPSPTLTPAPFSEAELYIPALQLVAVPVARELLSGASCDLHDLSAILGQVETSAWVDEPGNTVLVGATQKPDGTRGVFVNLAQLELGSRLLLTSGRTERVYQVVDVRQADATDVGMLAPTDDDRLTLLTCLESTQLGDIPQRVVVVAVRVN